MFGGDTKRALNASLLLSLVCSACALFSSFFTAKTAAAGFNGMLTGAMMCGFSLGGLMVLNRMASTANTGFLLGVGATMVPVSLQSAVFWGELAGDDRLSFAVGTNQGAARAVCAFSALFFLLVAFGFLPLLLRGRDEFSDGAQQQRDGMGGAGGGFLDAVGPGAASASLAGDDYGADPAQTKYQGSSEAADL